MTLARTLRARCVRPLLHVLLWGYVALLAGCGGSDVVIYGTGVFTVQASNAELFTAYRVNVDSITMTRNDGIVVEPLLYPQTVDFTQITDIGELLGAPAIPVGTYTSATITLDYSQPAIYVESGGNAFPLEAVGSDGTVQSVLTVTIVFDSAHPVIINSQQSTRIALNVDLAAFNNLDVGAGKVTVAPYAFMAAAPVDKTPLRSRGLFVTEMTVTDGFIMNTRPFIDQVSAIGAETVNITPQTYWNINGSVSTGAAGLTQLKTQQVQTPIIAYGTLGNLSGITPTFNATSIYVGTMAQDPLAEDITGVVSARSGNTLTIRGGTFFDLYLENAGLLPTLYFNTSTVTIDPSNTIVLEDGNAATKVTTNDISVGQQVHIYGQATLNSTLTTLTLDATSGLVRIQPNTLWGTLNSATPTLASFNLLKIGAFSPAAFSFAGTGAGSAQDANPLDYQVNTGSITSGTSDLSPTPVNTLLKAQGLVTAFGTAPPDFTASNVTGGINEPQHLVVQWSGTGVAKPFTTISASELVVNMTDATMSLWSGPQRTTLTSSPTITYSTQPGLRLGVALVTTADLATTVTATGIPADFVTAAGVTLVSPNTAWRLEAIGNYDSTTNTFVATAVSLNCL